VGHIPGGLDVLADFLFSSIESRMEITSSNIPSKFYSLGLCLLFVASLNHKLVNLVFPVKDLRSWCYAPVLGGDIISVKSLLLCYSRDLGRDTKDHCYCTNWQIYFICHVPNHYGFSSSSGRRHILSQFKWRVAHLAQEKMYLERKDCLRKLYHIYQNLFESQRVLSMSQNGQSGLISVQDNILINSKSLLNNWQTFYYFSCG
jgi:hypothetical protein